MSVTLQAAVHFGEEYTENLRSTNKRLIKDRTNNFWTDHDSLAAAYVERETTLLTERAVQFATAQTYAFSDSVLPVKAWESKIKKFSEKS